jgi:hypothetical protein
MTLIPCTRVDRRIAVTVQANAAATHPERPRSDVTPEAS